MIIDDNYYDIEESYIEQLDVTNDHIHFTWIIPKNTAKILTSLRLMATSKKGYIFSDICIQYQYRAKLVGHLPVNAYKICHFKISSNKSYASRIFDWRILIVFAKITNSNIRAPNCFISISLKQLTLSN